MSGSPASLRSPSRQSRERRQAEGLRPRRADQNGASTPIFSITANTPRIREWSNSSAAGSRRDRLTDRRVGLGTRIMQVTAGAAGAAGSVGHAAGLAISAPVSVVDPETRAHFGDQVEEFKDSVRRIGSDRPE